MKVFVSKTTILAFLLLTTAVIGFAGCSTATQNKNKDQAASTIQVEPTALPQSAGDEVQFKDSQGKTVSLGDLKGKVVFLNFWATWCPPCIAEMPSINKLKQSFNDQDDIVFLLVDVDNNIKKSTGFMKKKNYDLPVYVPAGPIPSTYLEGAIPTTVILDKKGEIIARIEGGRDYASPGMLKALNQLIESNY